MIFLETIMFLPFLMAAVPDVVPDVVPQAVPQVVPQPDGCLPVQEDRIFARDVAAAVPAFSSVAADFVLGYAPAPGTRRVFKGVALQKLALNQGVTVESAADVCFTRATATLESGAILEAMRSAWSAPDVRMELRSFSPQIAPQGKVVFPRTGLQLPAVADPQAEVVWRGYVLYGNNRRFSISARARITTTTTRVIALADLAVGEAVRDDQVRLESFDTFALDDRPARNLDEVVGYVPRSAIRSGSTVLRSQLSRAPEVARGDVVKVEVTAGGAHLLFEGKAQTDGVTGKTILVKNLTSGKDFRAVVTGKGKVSVQ
jgi:flagella basal body P-ring formation protein FlgA